MRAVTRFEANLLRVLRGLLQQAPASSMMAQLRAPMPRPKCLSRDAVELVQDSLAKGCVQFLARLGWMRERFLRHGKPVEGRLWQRTPPTELALTFSPHALELLLQLTSGKFDANVPKLQELTVGDRLLLVLAFNALRRTEVGERLTKHWLLLHQDGLCRLAFIEELVEGPQRFRIDWHTWTSGLGASVMEALQGWLAERWCELERSKGNILLPARMRKLGVTQMRVFGEFLDALHQAQRRDLARCLLDAGRRLLMDQPTALTWIHSLDVTKQRLADRAALYRDALAFVQQLERLHAWHAEMAAVGYFDDGYAASQLWKSEWERRNGDQLCVNARAVLREVEPI